MKVSATNYSYHTLSDYCHFLATSAVDLDTDKAIQEIIRGPAFKNVTILTIA